MRILVKKKPKGRDNMDKRFAISLRECYVNKVTGMLNQSMIQVNKPNAVDPYVTAPCLVVNLGLLS